MQKSLIAILPLAVLTLFTLSLVANPLNYALAQPAGEEDGDEETQRNIEKLTEILEKAQEHIEKIFDQIAGRNVTVPDAAKERYESGLTHAEDAIQALNENRTQAAEEEIIAAMNDFREALHQIRNANVTAATPITTGITQAINRSRVFIERLETIVDKAKETGYNTTNIEERIGRAKTILDNATALLEEGKIDEAAKKLGEARRAIAGLTGELNIITKAEKTKKIQEFTGKAIERLTEIEQQADELLPPQAAEKVKAAIERAKQHIIQARNLADEKRLENAVDELEDMLEDAEEGDDDLEEEIERERPAIAQRLEAAISVEKEKLETLRQRIGVIGDIEDAEEIREMFDEAEQLLQKASEELANGELRAAGETLKELTEITEEIQDSIRDAMEENRGMMEEDRRVDEDDDEEEAEEEDEEGEGEEEPERPQERPQRGRR